MASHTYKNSFRDKYGLQGSQCLAFHTVSSTVRLNLSTHSAPQLTTTIESWALYMSLLPILPSHISPKADGWTWLPHVFRLSQSTPPHYEHRPICLKDSSVVLSAPEGSISPLRTAHIEWKQKRHMKRGNWG